MQRLERRVVVTGIGLVTPLGIGTQQTWEAAIAGKSGVGPITHFDAKDLPCRIAGEVKGFDPAAFMDKKEARRNDLFIKAGLAASPATPTWSSREARKPPSRCSASPASPRRARSASATTNRPRPRDLSTRTATGSCPARAPAS